MREKIFRKFGDRWRKFARDNRGQTLATVAMVIIVLMVGGFFLMSWIVLSNLETIGKGILYLSIAILVMISVAILAKRYLFGKEVI